MLSLRTVLLVALLWNLALQAAFAQQPVPGTQAEDPAVAYARSVYFNEINVRKTIFSGPQYLEFDKLQYPYFQTDSARNGTVVYDGLAVDSVRLLYDIQADQLVMQYPDSPLQFLLDTARITDFTLGKHTFHRFAADSIRPAGLAAGFYDMLLTSGTLQLVAKRQKMRQEEIRERRKMPYYTLRNNFYVLEKHVALPVNRKKELYRLRPEKKKEMAAHMRSTGLSFRKNKENYLSAAVLYLNTLL